METSVAQQVSQKCCCRATWDSSNWKDGSIQGVCAKGNFEIDMIWKDGLLQEATLLSKAGENCTVKYAGKTISFKTAKGRSYQLKYDKENGLTQIRQ